MSKIPQLKLPLWQEIVYFVFVGIIPAVITALELFSSHSSMFKVTFSSLGSLLLVIVILRKFVFRNYIRKLEEKCILLEHDYSINVGNKDNIKSLWNKYNAITYSYSAIVLLLAVGLFALFVAALSEQLIAFRNATLFIFVSVMIAIVWKVALFLKNIKSSEDNSNEET